MTTEAIKDHFDLSKKFPESQKLFMTDDIRRSSRSVCANLALIMEKTA